MLSASGMRRLRKLLLLAAGTLVPLLFLWFG